MSWIAQRQEVNKRKREETEETQVNDRPVKKQRIMEEPTEIPALKVTYETEEEKQIKSVSTQPKTLLKEEILAVLNRDVVRDDDNPYKTKQFYSLDPGLIYSAYTKTDFYKRNGLSSPVWKKLFKFTLDKQTVNTYEPSKILRLGNLQLDSEDQYIKACAELYIQKNCISEAGEYRISPVSFSVLSEEVKSEVLSILQKINVPDTDKLEDMMYVPRYVRGLYKHASELIRDGISSVTMQYDVYELQRSKKIVN